MQDGGAGVPGGEREARDLRPQGQHRGAEHRLLRDDVLRGRLQPQPREHAAAHEGAALPLRLRREAAGHHRVPLPPLQRQQGAAADPREYHALGRQEGSAFHRDPHQLPGTPQLRHAHQGQDPDAPGGADYREGQGEDRRPRGPHPESHAEPPAGQRDAEADEQRPLRPGCAHRAEGRAGRAGGNASDEAEVREGAGAAEDPAVVRVQRVLRAEPGQRGVRAEDSAGGDDLPVPEEQRAAGVQGDLHAHPDQHLPQRHGHPERAGLPTHHPPLQLPAQGQGQLRGEFTYQQVHE